MIDRLAPQPGEWIDRSQEVRFEFEGRQYTGFAGDTSVRVALEGRLHQTRPNALQLSARSAQTSHRDDPRIAQMQPGIDR